MVACAGCTLWASSVPIVGSSGRCQGRRVPGLVAPRAATRRDSPIQSPGCDSSATSPSPSSFGRSSALHVRSSRGFPSTTRAARRSIVCDVAVKIGDSQSSGEQDTTKDIQPGCRIRVKVPLTVYHVMKSPKLNLQGLEGELKEVLKVFKGKTISANLPFKAQFFIDVDGKEVKFFAHLKEGEFDVVE